MDWSAIVDLVREYGLNVRVKAKAFVQPGDWGDCLFIPVPGYLESKIGPLPERDIAWLEIKTLQRVRRGRLIPDSIVDLSPVIFAKLEELNIAYKFEGDTVRIYHEIE